MGGFIIEDDYIDPDVAYLLGLIVARGQIVQRPRLNEIIIEFPMRNLQVQAKDTSGAFQEFDVQHSIQLGMVDIRERVIELMDCEARIVASKKNNHLILSTTRNSMAWRNILMHLDYKVGFRHMSVPTVLFHDAVTFDIRMEFVRGFADVAASIRPSNYYVDKFNRVRFEVLNENWNLPIQLCLLLQQFLGIPVQNITWGHPNLGRGVSREHAINIFAEPFLKVGSGFNHKSQVLKLLVEQDRERSSELKSPKKYSFCPGPRGKSAKRPKSKAIKSEEKSDKLPTQVRRHFDSYWQICRAIGCTVDIQLEPVFSSPPMDNNAN